MDQDHLKYFIENSQVGMVTYHQHDLNNKYCASGKIYEFLFEGKPVVTSTNPPLADFCGKYGIGIAEDNYEPVSYTHLDVYKRQSLNGISQISCGFSILSLFCALPQS